VALPTWDEMASISIRTLVEAKKYEGKQIFYLTRSDVDRSGRGYYFVKSIHVGKVTSKYFHSEDGSELEYKSIIRIKVKEPEVKTC